MMQGRSSKGVILITAVFMIGLAAVAILLILSLLRYDLQRTAAGARDAQLRQLLFAGELDAPAHLTRGETQWPTPAPGGAINTRVEDGACIVTATVDDTSARQRVVWINAAGGWKLVEVE